jgi:SH3-like domain-containing protein
VTDPVPPPTAAPPSDGGTGSLSVPEAGRTRAWSGARRPAPAAAPVTELFVEVVASASELRAEARPDAEVVARVSRGARLAVTEANEAAGWLRARDAEGRDGWIARDQVGNGSAAVVTSNAPREAPARRDAGRPAPEPAAPRALALRVDAGIGYRTFGMDFRSNGGDGLANYLVDAGAGAADLEREVIARLPSAWRVAVDGRLQLSRLAPGLEYAGPTSPAGKIAFGTLGADAGVRAGRRAGRAFELWLRAGGHYDAFFATEVENAGRLPRERLLGATAGARVELAPPGSRINATLWADALVLGSRRQTPGLEDGTDSRVRAVWAGATLRVRLRPHLSLLGAFDFGRVSTRWSGMSVRQPGATEARRTDESQLVQIGLGAEM